MHSCRGSEMVRSCIFDFILYKISTVTAHWVVNVETEILYPKFIAKFIHDSHWFWDLKSKYISKISINTPTCPAFQLQGLHVLRRLARHHPDHFHHDILTYIRATCLEVLNLRSQVSRLAIQILGDYFTWHKTAMDAGECHLLIIYSHVINLRGFIESNLEFP